MAYITAVEFAYLFGVMELDQLTDKGNTGTPAYEGFNCAVGTATALIDNACASRYVLPVTKTALIVQIAGDIARYYLYDDAPSGAVVDRYRDALKLLDDIKVGKLSVDGTELLPIDTAKKPTGK